VSDNSNSNKQQPATVSCGSSSRSSSGSSNHSRETMSVFFFLFCFLLCFVMEMERKLYRAAGAGLVQQVETILGNNPNIDVNWMDGWSTWCALHLACSKGHDPVVAILLAHPAINVNAKGKFGWTPFLRACHCGQTKCVRLLLQDARVNIDERNRDGFTALREAASGGHVEVIKWWIASGRTMYLGESNDWETDALYAARRERKPEVITLLQRFRENPGVTRYAVGLELGFSEEMAAEVFALVVFVSDGLLEIRQTVTATAASATRLFSIAAQLPLELQMVLCFRVVGSAKEVILGKDSEVAFRELARSICLPLMIS